MKLKVTLLNGINDSLQDANDMAELAQGNLNDVPQLIPYNPIMSMPHYCSLTPEEFESIRNNFGYIKYMLVFVLQVEMIKLQHVVN